MNGLRKLLCTGTAIAAMAGLMIAATPARAVHKDDFQLDGDAKNATCTFNIGDRSGVQKKTITVMTDDQPSQPTILKLTATIPQLLQIAPVFVYWSAKEVLDPKTINVNVGGDFQVNNLTVSSTDKGISTEVVPGPEKKEFKIIVKPTESGRPINAAIKIEPDMAKDVHKMYFANVRVDSRATATAPGTAPGAPPK